MGFVAAVAPVAAFPGDGGEKTRARTARPRAEYIPYVGLVVEVPEPLPDPLNEHGAPRDKGTVVAQPAPQSTNGGTEPGLSPRTIRDLADAYQERTYAQYQESGSTDVDHRPLDAWLRKRLRDGPARTHRDRV
jgi:hypothetical protein